MAKRDRYKEFEQLMTVSLLGNSAIFILYLVVAGLAIGWLKILLAVLAMVISVAGLVFLFLSKELLRSRSLWLSCGFFAIVICTLSSLILSYP